MKLITQCEPHFDIADTRGLARLISQVEVRDSQSLALMEQIYEARKGGYCLGVTGPPGAGKSTLVDRLIHQFRNEGARVGVVAIDPSSPFSGGAVLGDRVRMQAHAGDRGVYIRSIGSRGAHGGLSRATRDIIRIYDAYGFDWIIVETVGVGQTELAIMEIADTTLVVLVPEAGDTIQTMKAGLLEIADIFVVNKSDRDGAEQIAQALAAMVELSRLDVRATVHEVHDATHGIRSSSRVTSGTLPADRGAWHVPVVRTVAAKGEGLEELGKAIRRHRAQGTNALHHAHQGRLRELEFMELCEEAMRQRLKATMDGTPRLKQLLADVVAGKANPYRAAAEVVKKLK